MLKLWAKRPKYLPLLSMQFNMKRKSRKFVNETNNSGFGKTLENRFSISWVIELKVDNMTLFDQSYPNS